MEWFGMRLLRKARFLSEDEPHLWPEQAQASIPAPGPDLVLFLSEATGPAARQIHRFSDTAAAAEFIQFWSPISHSGDLAAFWALTWRPEPDSGREAAEPVVIIRDTDHPGVVYPFSFAEMETAAYFIQREVEKGLDLAAIALYWAVPVRIQTDHEGRVQFSPEKPPARREPPAPGRAPSAPAFGGRHPTGWRTAGDRDAMSGRPLSFTVDEVIEAAERAVAENGHSGGAPEVRLDDVIQQRDSDGGTALAEPRPSADDSSSLAGLIAEAERIASEPPGAEKRPLKLPRFRRKSDPNGRRGSRPHAVRQETEPEKEVAFSNESGFDAPHREAAAQIEEAAAVIEEAIQTIEKSHRLSEAQRSQPDPFLRRPDPLSREGVDRFRNDQQYLEYLLKLKKELSKFRKVTRWQKREEPFQGFESPPGRF